MMRRSGPGVAPGMVARRFTISTGPAGVVASNRCSSTATPIVLSLTRDVVARLPGAGRSGDARADVDQAPDVLEGARAVKRRRGRRGRLRPDAAEAGDESDRDGER